MSLKESHFYRPEGEKRSRVFVLMYMKAHSPIAHFLKNNLLKLIDVVVDQDAKILERIYANTPQRIKLNNEVGMDWFDVILKTSLPSLNQTYLVSY